MQPNEQGAAARESADGFAARSRKVICSIGHGTYEALLALTRPTFVSYAARHGYDLVLRGNPQGETRPVAWAKVPLILELLESHDLVLWIDADAIIVDDSDDLAAEVRPDRWMYLSHTNTPEGLVPNTGVWMFTSCGASRQFLRSVDARVALTHHKWWENAAVIELLGYHFDPVRPGCENEFTSGVSFIDRQWNSIWIDPAPRPRIKHYAGLPFNERYEALASELDALRASGRISSSTNAPKIHRHAVEAQP